MIEVIRIHNMSHMLYCPSQFDVSSVNGVHHFLLIMHVQSVEC